MNTVLFHIDAIIRYYGFITVLYFRREGGLSYLLCLGSHRRRRTLICSLWQRIDLRILTWAPGAYALMLNKELLVLSSVHALTADLLGLLCTQLLHPSAQGGFFRCSPTPLGTHQMPCGVLCYYSQTPPESSENETPLQHPLLFEIVQVVHQNI